MDEHFVQIHLREFKPEDLAGQDLVIAATNIPALNREVQRAAKEQGKLINVADTPDLCDF
jgi:siroheme synthase (precorrin-2 oxidase/ferrochelatase)